MRRFRFRALITLDGTEPHPRLPGTGQREYPNHTRDLMVEARPLRGAGCTRHFPAELCWDGERPLHPGDRAEVTITVADDEARAFFDAGQRFTIWSGGDVGHGVVSRRVFTDNSPS